ncbi:RIP metalloprotease RseP [Pontibacterium granulatum]|uniref:RIP metalloprotease RseP n=1 Tax=Pontibacterium granulatum TaxID=2036029 RepID=UPI00249C88BA|nr:RIP metalloprotease RseP [Pontibacterium granulatum]MDI3322960.1 RIP metalloprotease RseP [Pontibacterium granulatum]
MDLLQTLLATLVTLGILVTIHEWGHFFVARRCGVKVLTFSIGFGRSLFRWRSRRSGTEYVLAAIPLGGYVRMLDEREGEVPEALKSQAFNRKPVLQRIAVVGAGPAVNLIFAVLAYWFMFVYGVNAIKPTVTDVVPGSPAALADVRPGGEITAVDGKEALSWESVNLLLASRIGESGALNLRMQYPGVTLPEEYVVQLDNWTFDVESQSPVNALGLVAWSPEVPAVVGRLLDEGVAAQAGLRAGDHVLEINKEPIQDWYALVEYVQRSPGENLALLVDRDGHELIINVRPMVRQTGDATIGYIGAGVAEVAWPPEQQRVISFGVLESLGKGIGKTWQMITLILDSIWKMLEGVISVKNLSGPITIAKVAGASAESGMEEFIGFLAYLSISLGVLNLLPIPMLDGGHLFYYTVELLRGKPVSERIQMAGLRLGMAIIFTLMSIAIINDVMRL